jgi:purine nucleosidase
MQDAPNFDAQSDVPHVIVDCDPGIDDALALLMLARAHQAGLLVLDSVSTVGGNVAAVRTASNAASVLERAGLPDSIVVMGADTPLTGRRVTGTSISIHGNDGLGGLAATPRTGARVSEEPGKDLANRILLCPNRPLLLCIGPLTNVALALKAHPAITDALSRVVIMGGALGNPSGNITPDAEFNFHFDPVAASIVLGSGLPIELVALDVTEAVPFDPHDLEGLSSFARALLAASLRLHREALGSHVCYVHDAIAAAVLLDTDLADYSCMRIAITTSRTSAGHVEVCREGVQDGSVVEVVSHIDGVRTKNLFHALLDAPRGDSAAEGMLVHMDRSL